MLECPLILSDTGIRYDYWTQNKDAFEVLMELSFVSPAVGFAVAWIFLGVKLFYVKRRSLSKIFLVLIPAGKFSPSKVDNYT